MLVELIMAYMASLSFAYIFNLNRKTAFLSAFGGSLGWLFYSESLSYFSDPNVAFFFGAVAFTYYGELMARKMRTPVTSYITPGLIPLVPGSGLYHTMLKSLEGDYYGALREGITTIMASGALAIGILMVFTLMKIYYLFKRRVMHEKN